jgi:polysaccharide biosynthesis transport protein
LRDKREALKKLSETLNASSSDMLNLQQKLALETLTMLRQGLAQEQFEYRRFKSELAAEKALLQSIDTTDMSDAEMDVAVQTDPIAQSLSRELSWKKMEQVYTENAVVPGVKTHYADRFTQEIETLKKQYETRRMELAGIVRQKKRSEVVSKVKKLEAAVAATEEQVKISQDEVLKQQAISEKYGKSNVDVDMLQASIKNLDTLLGNMNTERAKLGVEIRAPGRIKIISPAEKPERPSNNRARMMMTIVAMCGAFIMPTIAIIFFDIRNKRINNCADVSKGLRLPVIGSVPLIPTRVLRQLGSPAKRYQMWHVRLTESIDGVAARVLRKADMEKCRVIMVSSAVGSEGKTTLATQLAMSLARVGRRTVLVDFDLRRPTMDEMFGLPLSPGVCEGLRQENPVSELIHAVAAENLSVVSAGRWDRNALAALSNGFAGALLKELREEFDFVIVDTSPILPVADARFVSQHVDSVVLSVFRDISEAPKIQATCEILAAFGVSSVEAVVTGPNVNMYGEHAGYESTISA